MQIWVAWLFVLGVSACGGGEPPTPRCPDPAAGSVELPGPGMGDYYSKIKAAIPPDSDCHRVSEDGCRFMSREGSEILLTDTRPISNGGYDRYVFAKVARREQSPQLPVGILWSDSPQEIVRKLSQAGVELIGDSDKRSGDWDFGAHGCLREGGARFSMVFSFRDERLVEVKQRDTEAY